METTNQFWTRGQTQQPPDVKMQIGDREYLVDVHIAKIPYLRAYLDFQLRSGQLSTTQMLVHKDIPFFGIINHAVKHGFHRIFSLMPARLEAYRRLCWTMDYLAINVCQGRDLSGIIKELGYLMKHDPSYQGNSAFRLLYMFLLGDLEAGLKGECAAYMAVRSIYGVSTCTEGFQPGHHLDWKTKKLIREAYDERFDSHSFQLRHLDKLAGMAKELHESANASMSGTDDDLESEWPDDWETDML